MKALKAFGIGAVLAAAVGLAACARDADVASYNLSYAADNFQVMRRVVFYNGITDTYILKVEGLCSIGNDDKPGILSITCKTGPNEFIKHFLGRSDNVTFFAEQMRGVDVSTYHYQVTFKPQNILPDIDFKGDAGELLKNRN